MARARPLRWVAVLALSVLVGCHEAVLWEPRPEFVSQVAERVDTAEYRLGTLPVYELDGLEIVGDMSYLDYRWIRITTADRTLESEQLLRLENVAAIRGVGGATPDPLASFTLDTCTDCDWGSNDSRKGRTFVYGRESGSLALWNIWWWVITAPADQPSR